MHNDYAREIITTLAARADSGELVDFGWGGELRDWQRRLVDHVLTEGYGRVDGPVLSVTQDGLGFHTGCTCEGCTENAPADGGSGYGYAARRLLIALKQARESAYQHTYYCRACNASRNTHQYLNGLCNVCAGFDE